MLEAFTSNDFRGKTLAVIEQANVIIAEYQRQGFTLTLRQLYYQFVSRDLIPNLQTEYKKLGATLSKARLAGLVDWSAIEDRTRNLKGGDGGYDSPEAFFNEVMGYYYEPMWTNQPRHIEVWIEKDALLGVIEPVCDRWRLPYFACRGSVSQSEMYTAGKRLADMRDLGREPLVLHLGDHDPSGVHMTEDNTKRLSLFSNPDPENDWTDAHLEHEGIEVRRLALNMDQIRRYNPPPNPAKESDARYDAYVRDYGTTQSWELDALEPRVIDRLIEDEVRGEIDMDAWNEAKRSERANAASIRELKAVSFDQLRRFLKHRETEVLPDVLDLGYPLTANRVLDAAEGADPDGYDEPEDEDDE